MLAVPGVSLWAWGGGEALVGEAVVRHEEQDAGGGDDAGQRGGEHADEDADIDDQAERGDACLRGEVMEGCGGLIEGNGGGVEAEGFAVAAEDEEGPGENGGLDDRAGNGAERVFGLGAKGGGGLKADEAEDRQHDAEADATEGHGAQAELDGVEVEAVLEEDERDDDGDQEDGDAFDVKHQAGGDLDVAVGDPACSDRSDRDERDGQGVGDEWRGSGEAEVVEERFAEEDEPADDGRGCRDVREEECPGGERREHRREREASVGEERAGRGTFAGEGGDGEADEDHEQHRDEVGDGGALSGEGEDEGYRERGRGAGRDGGDGLRESLDGREDVVAQAKVFDAQELGAAGGNGCVFAIRAHGEPQCWD